MVFYMQNGYRLSFFRLEALSRKIMIGRRVPHNHYKSLFRVVVIFIAIAPKTCLPET